MKQLLKKFRLRHPDEMEQAILLRAQRNAYLFLVISLLIWSLAESCQVYRHHGRLNLLPCFLLVLAAIIQMLSQAIMARSAVKDETDSWETGPLIRIVLLVCAAASLAATAAAAFILMGVRT